MGQSWNQLGKHWIQVISTMMGSAIAHSWSRVLHPSCLVHEEGCQSPWTVLGVRTETFSAVTSPPVLGLANTLPRYSSYSVGCSFTHICWALGVHVLRLEDQFEKPDQVPLKIPPVLRGKQPQGNTVTAGGKWTDGYISPLVVCFSHALCPTL